MDIHPDDERTHKRVEILAYMLAEHFHLDLWEVVPKARPYVDGNLGYCLPDKRRISMLYRYRFRKSEGGRWYTNPLPLSEVFATTIHEVCHLPRVDTGEWLHDGPDHRTLERIMFKYVKQYWPQFELPEQYSNGYCQSAGVRPLHRERARAGKQARRRYVALA